MPDFSLFKEKHKIAKAFNRSASNYSHCAKLQRRVGYQLWQLAKDYLNNPKIIVDLGSGDSHFSKMLANNFPMATILSLDMAYLMLSTNATENDDAKYKCICADFDYLPLRNHSIEMIFANMSLQWSLDYLHTYSELHRVLAINGVLLIAIPCQGTFTELTTSLQAIDADRHVNHFLTLEQLVCDLQQAGFTISLQACQTFQCYYRTCLDILHEIRATGTNHIKFNNQKHLLGKHYVTRLTQVYEAYRNQQAQLPLTYQIGYLIVKKPN